MKLYWSCKSIPELADLPKEKRKKVWQECRGKVFRHWQTWFLILIQGLLGVIAIESIRSYFGSYNAVGLILVMIIGGLIGGVTSFFIQPLRRSDIREYLNSNEKTN
jgi:hypothetical protein